jgi:4-azaleucine resistance transporter AzlC
VLLLQNTNRSKLFIKGASIGFSIAIGYFPIAVTFGLLASQQAGLNLYESTYMSLWVFAGASQYIAVELLAQGVSSIAIIVATFILNLRHLLMSAVLSQQLKVSKLNPFLAFGITDETFAVATMSTEKEKDEPLFFAGVMLTAYSSWILGTMAGVLFAGWIPESLGQSMGIALYAMFIGLLVPSLKKGLPVIVTAALGAALSWGGQAFLSPYLSKGWTIVLATLLATTFGFLFFGSPDKEGRA